MQLGESNGLARKSSQPASMPSQAIVAIATARSTMTTGTKRVDGLLLEPAADLEAVAARRHEIDEHEVGRIGGAGRQSLSAV